MLQIEEIQHIKNILETDKLWIYIHKKYSSKNDSHRTLIRKNLIQKLKYLILQNKLKMEISFQKEQKSPLITYSKKITVSKKNNEILDAQKTLKNEKILKELEQLLNVDKIPQTSFSNQSISHCSVCGGFIITPPFLDVGLDLENSKRDIHKKTVLKVADLSELQEAPCPEALWMAKEASFKSIFRTKNIKLLSQIFISKWAQEKNNNCYSFFFKIPTLKKINFSGKGLIWHFDCFKLGIALINPKLLS